MAAAAVFSSGDVSAEQVAKFVARWQASEAAERVNDQLFLSELCGLLGVPQPESAKADVSQNAYVFERDVAFQTLDGTTSIEPKPTASKHCCNHWSSSTPATLLGKLFHTQS